jgi:hypothetical protein
MKSTIKSIAAFLTSPFHVKKSTFSSDYEMLKEYRAKIYEPNLCGPKDFSDAVKIADEMAVATGLCYQVIEDEPERFTVISEYYFLSNIHKVLYSTPARKNNLPGESPS